ncbi:nucleotide disphospho-sugar-binding domain-containing protein [Amycolatopsis sp. cmx-4-68]|uniref:nucleotide disphospho-sugar-binding domain-containing protein n=1 Tax=Amycolatopsis sp. cmx-4-68 TaxID=2790938 RepID=UPI00397B0497
MRVLLTTYPEKTFFYHLVPLAWALRTAGHEVRVACPPKFAAVVTQAGLTAVPVGSDRNFWRITETRAGGTESMRAGIMPPYDAFDDVSKQNLDYLQPGLTEAVRGWHRVSNFPMVAGLVEFARAWQPDLVVWEPLSQAGAIAARACGAAHARMLWSVDLFGGVRDHYLRLGGGPDPFEEWFSGYGRKYGFEFGEDLVTGDFTLDHVPGSLQVEAELPYVRFRYVPYGGPASTPDWLQRPAGRPRIAFTMGLSATEIFGGYHLPLSDVLDALSDVDAEVVATATGLGPVPANVRLVSYVPLHALAPTCAAAVHHGGLGTLATFARAGVPQLCVPHHLDEPIFAAGLARVGAGIDLREPTAETIRASVERLLAGSFAAGATQLKSEMDALPSPNDIVPELEDLTAKYRAR